VTTSDAYADAFSFTPGALQRVEFELEPRRNAVDHEAID